MMKLPILIAFLLLLNGLNAQTALIAHKSHSGSEVSYFVDPNSNFGIFIEPTYSLPGTAKTMDWYWLNDSTILRMIYENGEVIEQDTIRNKDRVEQYKFELEDYTSQYEIHRKQDSIKKSADSIFLHQFQVSPINEKNYVPIIGTPKQNNNPSFLLVLLAVSAILMVLVRMVVRDRKTVIFK